MIIDIPKILEETHHVIAEKVRNHNVSLDESTVETSDKSLLVKNPLVSVPIMAYNHENYIRECLDSVLSQKVDFPYEIIISEDCSQDKTREICFEYQKTHPDKIRVLWSNYNVGLVRNMLRMHARDRGEIICGIAGDDYWASPYRMQKAVDYLNSHLDASMVHCGAYTQLEQNKFTRCHSSCAEKERRSRISSLDRYSQGLQMLRCNYVTGPTSARRLSAMQYATSKIKELQDVVGWVPSEDFPTWFYMTQVGKIGYIPEDLVSYRLNKGSITANTNDYVVRQRILGDARVTLAIAMLENIDDNDFIQDVVVGLIKKLLNLLVVTGEDLNNYRYCFEIGKKLSWCFEKEYVQAMGGDLKALKQRFKPYNQITLRYNASYMVLKRIAMAILGK